MSDSKASTEPSSKTVPPKGTESSDIKEDILDKEIKNLFKRLEETMQAHEKSKLKFSRVPNPIVTKLRKYVAIYSQTTPEEHKDYFLSVYNNSRAAILNGIKSDEWLRGGNVQVRYGEGILDGKNNQYVIMLSCIYKNACTLREDAQKRLEGLPDAAYLDCHELIYADTILLHLYRIFSEVVPTKDTSKIRDIVQQLEDILGMQKKSSDSSEGPFGNSEGGLLGALEGVAPLMGNITSDEGFSKIIGLMTNVLKELKCLRRKK
jgi:hypothetical protein